VPSGGLLTEVLTGGDAYELEAVSRFAPADDIEPCVGEIGVWACGSQFPEDCEEAQCRDKDRRSPD
jgi:hypothetical protein